MCSGIRAFTFLQVMKSLLLPAFLLAFAVPCLHAQAPTAPPGAPAAPLPEPLTDEQTARILEEITKVQKEFARTKKEVVANALSKFQSVLGDSDAAVTDLYLAAYRVVHLERKPATSKEEAKERENGEWREKALASLGPGASATTLRLQLQLLVLRLQAALGREEDKTIAALREYMQNVAAYLQTLAAAPQPEPDKRAAGNGPRNNGRRPPDDPRDRRASPGGRALQQSVMSSLFAEAYNLDTYLDDVKGLPQSPLDFSACYTGLLLPWYRANRVTDLSGVWDEYLRLETLKVQAAHDPDAAAAWAAGAYKQLYWGKWLDLLSFGISAPTATTELITLIRENPLHPQLKTWIADLAKIGEKMGGLKFGDDELSAGAQPPAPTGTTPKVE